MYTDVIGFCTDIENGRSVYCKLETLVLVIEFDKRALGSLGGLFYVSALVVDNGQKHGHKIRIEESQESELETERKSSEERHPVLMEMEKGCVQGEEKRDHHDFTETPQDIMPPLELDVLVKEIEEQSCDCKDTDHDAGEHQKMEGPGFPGKDKIVLEGERCIDEDENKKEERNQKRKFHLRPTSS